MHFMLAIFISLCMIPIRCLLKADDFKEMLQDEMDKLFASYVF